MSFDFKKMLVKECNIGLKEQKMRYAAGAFVAFLSVFLGNVFLLLLGIVLIATGFSRWCPAYSGMGKSTVEPGEEAPTAAAGGGHH